MDLRKGLPDEIILDFDKLQWQKDWIMKTPPSGVDSVMKHGSSWQTVQKDSLNPALKATPTLI